jgi:dihydrofolate reductase
MTISIIVAASDNNVIGKNNQLLWNLPTDMRYFKSVTWGMPVIMGRKTFESLGQPLKGRLNVVITRKKDWSPPGVVVANNLEAAFKAARDADTKEMFILGGGEVYAQSIKKANKIHLTRVHGNFDGDTVFPVLDSSWNLSYRVDFPADEKHAYPFSIEIWVANRKA